MRKCCFSTLCYSVLIITGVLSGCGSREAHSDIVAPNEEAEAISTEAVYEADTVITITGWLEEPYTQNLMAYLAENYPEYSIKYKFIGKKSYESIIDAELASNEASDIVMVNPIMAKKHGKNGYIIDLSDFCSDYAKEAWDAFSYDGKMYAVPSTSEYQCTFFNREIFEKFGRKLPSEYEDFLKFSDDMKEELGIKPLSCGIKDADMLADNVLAFLAANYFYTEKGKGFGERVATGTTSFGSEIQPFLYQWKEMVNHGIFTKEMCVMDSEAAIEEFAAGKSFMYMGVVEDYNRIMEKNPDIKLGTMGVTGAVRGTAVLIGGCNSGFAVNSYSSRSKEAVKIVAALATENGQRALWSDRIGSRTFLKNVEFKNPSEFDGLRPIITARRVYMPSAEWGEHGTQIYEILGTELQKIVSGERNVDVAAQVMDYEVNRILKKD